MAKKKAEIEPITGTEAAVEQLPAEVLALRAKFEQEMADPNLSARRRKFLEVRHAIHGELHDVFRRLA